MRDDYIHFILTTYIRSATFDDLFGETWVDEELLPNLKLAAVKEAFAARGFDVNPLNFQEHFDRVFQEVLDAGGFGIEGDDLLGHWYRLERDNRNRAVKDMLSRSPVAQKLNNLGETSFEALRRAISKILSDAYVAEDHSDSLSLEAGLSLLAPAANRIVSLDHNLAPYKEVESGLIALSEELKGNNEFGETAEERARIITSVEAARELWKSADLKLIQVRVGIVMAIEDAGVALEKVGKATAWSLLVDLIKSIVKDKTGIAI